MGGFARLRRDARTLLPPYIDATSALLMLWGWRNLYQSKNATGYATVKRLIKNPGDVFEIPLSGGRHGYAQWLSDDTARIFTKVTKVNLSVEQVLALPVAFRVLVARPSPGRHGWSKIGKAEIPAAYVEPQRYAKKDVISGALTSYFKGVEKPATASELRGLETLAVWGHPHIIERLEAVAKGRKSKFHEQLRVIA